MNEQSQNSSAGVSHTRTRFMVLPAFQLRFMLYIVAFAAFGGRGGGVNTAICPRGVGFSARPRGVWYIIPYRAHTYASSLPSGGAGESVLSAMPRGRRGRRFERDFEPRYYKKCDGGGEGTKKHF